MVRCRDSDFGFVCIGSVVRIFPYEIEVDIHRLEQIAQDGYGRFDGRHVECDLFLAVGDPYLVRQRQHVTYVGDILLGAVGYRYGCVHVGLVGYFGRGYGQLRLRSVDVGAHSLLLVRDGRVLILEAEFLGHALVPEVCFGGLLHRQDLGVAAVTFLVTQYVVFKQRDRLLRVPRQFVSDRLVDVCHELAVHFVSQNEVALHGVRIAVGGDVWRGDLEAEGLVVALVVLLGLLRQAESHGEGLVAVEFCIYFAVGDGREDQLAVLGQYVAFVRYGSLGGTGYDLGNERSLHFTLVDLLGEGLGQRSGSYAECDLHFGLRCELDIVLCLRCCDIVTAHADVHTAVVYLRRNEYDRLNAACQIVDGVPNSRNLLVVLLEDGREVLVLEEAFRVDLFHDGCGQHAVFLFQGSRGSFVDGAYEVVGGLVLVEVLTEVLAQQVLDGRLDVLHLRIFGQLVQNRVHDFCLLGCGIFTACQIFFDSLSDVRLNLAPCVESFDLGIENILDILLAHSFGN